MSDIMVVIGPNEAGKSGILNGLASLSMDAFYAYFDLTQLEGMLKRYNDNEIEDKDIPMVHASFELAPEEIKELGSLLQLAEEPKKIMITKYFDESYQIKISDKAIRVISRAKVNDLMSEMRRVIANHRNSATNTHLTHAPNDAMRAQFNSAAATVENASPAQTVKSVALSSLQEITNLSNAAIDAPFKTDLVAFARELQSIMESFMEDEIAIAMYKFVLERMPRTIYFKTWDRLEDEVTIAELRANPQKHKTFINFLKLAQIKLDTIEYLQDETKRQVYLESGCGRATKLLRGAWRQEELDMELRYSTEKLMVFTKNSAAVETLLPPSLGSEGFQWFLGFFINFGAETNSEFKRAILLLDDPGVFLHPKGHKDLLDLFESYLGNGVTTIYTTHLPFLIPRSKLERLRLVRKKGAGYTEVTEKFYAIEDKDVLYPLRAALGVSLGDSLFVGEKTIVGEGPSDRILLDGMLQEFNSRKIRKIDLEHISVVAGKGARGAKEYALLLQIENLPYVVVLDNDDEGRNASADFQKDGIPTSNVILLSNHRGVQADLDIEDLFPLETYAEAFHSVHGKSLNLSKVDVLKAISEGNGKVTNKGKSLLKTSKYDLDKVKIAYEMLRITNSLTQLDQALVENLSKIFDGINSRIAIYSKE
ncbi:MAG: TOPRIM nucleotidyl transferase/hydrolase domain-containing protein [Nitrososphaera sp.]|jgi:predicted ATP-dependent endonuclease of OLD family